MKTIKTITILADKMSIRTRNSDNALIVTFETGEYELDNVAELMKLMKVFAVYKVTVEIDDGTGTNSRTED